MRKSVILCAVAVIAVFAFLCAPAANAAPITSFVAGNVFATTTWSTGTVPTVGDTAIIKHTVKMDLLSATPESDEVWDADTVQIDAGGTLDGVFGRLTVNALIFNGGTMTSSGNDGVSHNADSVTINNVAGNKYTNTKNLRNTTLNTPTLAGSGTLGLVLAKNKIMTLNVTDTTGFTGLLDATFETRNSSAPAADQVVSGSLKFSKSILEADASFGLELSKFIYDWTGGSGADDGTAYSRLDIKNGTGDGSVLWFTSLKLGDYVVPERTTAYTYTELVGLNAANANYLSSDGADAVVGVPEPATMGLLAFGGLFVLRRRRVRRA